MPGAYAICREDPSWTGQNRLSCSCTSSVISVNLIEMPKPGRRLTTIPLTASLLSKFTAQGSRKFADDTVHAAQAPEASYTEPTWQRRSVQRNPHRGNFTHWGHDFYTMFRASADGVATTSISPCWSVTSTRTASFRRSKNTSTCLLYTSPSPRD